MAREFDSAAFGADGDVVDDLSGGGGLIDAADEVDQNGFSTSGSSDDTDDLSFGYFEVDIVQNPYHLRCCRTLGIIGRTVWWSVCRKIHAEVLNGNKRCRHANILYNANCMCSEVLLVFRKMHSGGF